jgi:hypothetical protein
LIPNLGGTAEGVDLPVEAVETRIQLFRAASDQVETFLAFVKAEN